MYYISLRRNDYNSPHVVFLRTNQRVQGPCGTCVPRKLLGPIYILTHVNVLNFRGDKSPASTFRLSMQDIMGTIKLWDSFHTFHV